MTGSQNSSPLQPLFASSLSDVKAGFFANVEATKTIPGMTQLAFSHENRQRQ